MIGVRIGPWVIDAELGRGGMGAVYRALRVEPGEGPERAAVKVLAAELAVEEGFRQRFGREIDILRKLDHPGIVKFYESGDQGGRYYYVMEYVPGANFEQVTEESDRLPWEDVLTLALQVAPALKHAHDRGVIHRDLKPSNLLREPLDAQRPDGPWRVKLTDFGIASLFASPHLTVTGGVIGTPEYLSPEQAAGKPVTPRSDLYSLGVLLYTLLAGRPPFEGTPVELLHKHRYGQFDRLSRLVPGLPPDLEDIVGQLLEKEPAKRPPDAGVLARRLESLRRKLDRIAAGESETPAPAPGRPGGRKQGPATLMSRLMRQHLDEEVKGGPARRLLEHPLTLVLLFALVVGGIAWAFWPPTEDRLYRAGVALMASDDPEDWDRAWEKYLGPLEQRFPGHGHAEELAPLRRKYADHLAERAAARAARAARPQGEAEWFYYQGLRLRRRGDEAGARRVWQDLTVAYRDVPAERPWVRKAELELKADPADGRAAELQWSATADAVRQAAALRREGKEAEAAAVERALEALYRGDTGAAGPLAGFMKGGGPP